MTDLISFEDYLYSKMAVSTVKDTIRKMRFFDRKVDLSSRDAILEFLRNERRNGFLAKNLIFLIVSFTVETAIFEYK